MQGVNSAAENKKGSKFSTGRGKKLQQMGRERLKAQVRGHPPVVLNNHYILLPVYTEQNYLVLDLDGKFFSRVNTQSRS